MDSTEKLNLLRAMVGVPNTEEGWSDETLHAFLLISGQKIIRKAYPYKPETKKVPPQYHVLQCEIAAYLLNKRGAEGQIGHSENGISRQYENGDVPDSMLSVIVPYCGSVAK